VARGGAFFINDHRCTLWRGSTCASIRCWCWSGPSNSLAVRAQWRAAARSSSTITDALSGAVRRARRSVAGTGADQVTAWRFARSGARRRVLHQRSPMHSLARFDVRVDPLLVLERTN
jgi:hypothetical protein